LAIKLIEVKNVAMQTNFQRKEFYNMPLDRPTSRDKSTDGVSAIVHFPSRERDPSSQLNPFFPQITLNVEADISNVAEMTLIEALTDPMIALLNHADGVSRQRYVSTMELAQQAHIDRQISRKAARANEHRELLHAVLDLPVAAWPSREH
jgi:hypothetical protein